MKIGLNESSRIEVSGTEMYSVSKKQLIKLVVKNNIWRPDVSGGKGQLGQVAKLFRLPLNSLVLPRLFDPDIESEYLAPLILKPNDFLLFNCSDNVEYVSEGQSDVNRNNLRGIEDWTNRFVVPIKQISE